MSSSAEDVKRRYTYKDYCLWPDGERWELIAGVPYSMSPAPNTSHQRIVGRLHLAIGRFLEGKPCEVLISPVDVLLFPSASDEEVDTIVQPDLLVVCDEKKITPRAVEGPPDAVIEVLSESTAAHDQKVKFELYERAGVREYWIVNPWNRTVTIHRRGEDGRLSVIQTLTPGDNLTTPIIPGLSFSLDRLFDR